MTKEIKLMNKLFTCIDYVINDMVYYGTFKADRSVSISRLFLKNKRLNIENDEIEFGYIENDDVYFIRADMSDKGLAVGIWYPMYEDADGNKGFCSFSDLCNTDGHIRLIEMSPDRFCIDGMKHFCMGIIDSDSNYAIRKIGGKSDFIYNTPLYVKEYSDSGYIVSFSLEDESDYLCIESELWVACKATKCVKRSVLNAEMINDGHIDIDFSQFVMDKACDIYVACNREGRCYISRLILKNKKYNGSYAVPLSDDSDRFILNIPDNDKAYQLFFDDYLALSQRHVDRVNMYRGVYRGCIDYFSMNDSVFKLRISFDMEMFEGVKLVLRHREENADYYAGEFIYQGTCIENSGHRKKQYEYDIDCREINWNPHRYDILLTAVKDNHIYEFRLIKNGNKINRVLSDIYRYGYTSKDNRFVFLTETVNGNLIIECRNKTVYDDVKYKKNERRARFLYKLVKPFIKIKKTVLFYEKFCTAAQDNSYYMFDYVYKMGNKKIRPLYIIEKNQPVYEKLKHIYNKNIVDFMSVKHLIYLQAADLFVSTDSKRHCYKWRAGNTKLMKMLEDKPFIFLQHGVVGFKKVDHIYGKQCVNRANLFVVSSENEKEIVSKNFGYDNEEIIITGLARWDVLKSEPENPPMIFYMPTWRNWIYETNEEEFLKSDYYNAFSKLLSSDKLSELLVKNNINMIFCFHPKFRQFLHCIKTNCPNIKFASYDDGINVNELLMRCSLFITDYSSASWDVAYMDKPVIFYQFDYEKYMDRQGSYIDMENNLFGRRAIEYKDFIAEIEDVIERDFQLTDEEKNVNNAIFELRDENNRKRIYEYMMEMLR